MPAHPFLSPEWIDAARTIYDDAGGAGGIPDIKMNMVIIDVPFGDGPIDAHMDSSSGSMQMDVGHMDEAEVTIRVPYEIAKAIFVEGNAQAGMQAFMAGHIKVEGDLAKLMAMQSAAPDAAALDVQRQVQAITA